MPDDIAPGGVETGQASGSLVFSDEGGRVLQMVTVPTVMEAARIEILEKLVFARIEVLRDIRKEYLSYQNLLRGNSAHKICTIIWNHSETQNGTPILNGRAIYGGGVTQHGLAVALSEDPSEVSKLNTYVRNVAIAGAAYGLIERDIVHATRVYLRGTSLLNDYMVALARSYTEIISSLGGADPPIGRATNEGQ